MIVNPDMNAFIEHGYLRFVNSICIMDTRVIVIFEPGSFKISSSFMFKAWIEMGELLVSTDISGALDAFKMVNSF